MLVTFDDDIDTEKPSMICSCCSCCCGTLKKIVSARNFGLVEKSPFIVDFNNSNCTLCELCIDRCQFKVFSIENEKLILDQNICHGCGLCIGVCDKGALALVSRDVWCV